MKTHFITVDNAWPALKERGMAGVIPASEAYPVHALASDLHYTLLENGVLSCLFQAKSLTSIHFDNVLNGLPYSSGLQLYSHHLPSGEANHFLALSSLVPYRYQFSPLRGFVSLIKRHSLNHELESLQYSTRDSYETLLHSVEGESKNLNLLSNPSPLLQVLGPIRISEGNIKCSESITYNLSYLLLEPSRLALLIEFNDFMFPEYCEMFHPTNDLATSGLEYLAATCIHRPDAEGLSKLDVETEDYQSFLKFFRKEGQTKEKGFPALDLKISEKSPNPKGKVLAKHYVLLFGSSLVDLMLKVQGYIRDLCHKGVSFHASMIRTRENYCHLYPGNYRLINDGILMDAYQAPFILKALHP